MTLMGAYAYTSKTPSVFKYWQKVWSNLAEAMSPATPQGILLHYYCQCLPSTDQQRRKRLRHAELPLQLHVGHRISFPNCGILIAHNFNRLDMSCFCNAFQLKQIVKFWMGSNWSSPTWPHLHQNEGLLQDPHQTPYLRPLRPCHQWDPSPTLTAQTKDLAICVPLYTPKQKNWTWSLPL